MAGLGGVSAMVPNLRPACCCPLPPLSGRERPPRPVRMYKDTLVTATAAADSGTADAPIEGPRLVVPVSYTLVR